MTRKRQADQVQKATDQPSPRSTSLPAKEKEIMHV